MYGNNKCMETIKEYLGFLSQNTGWRYNEKRWSFDNFHLYEFTKKTDKPGVHSFNNAIKRKFISLAITAIDTMEYTLEMPDKLP